MIDLRPYQKEAIDLLRESFSKGNKRVILSLPTGAGKCLARGTKVLMFDGTTQNVEDITIGNKLMGVDSTPRTVLSTTTGVEQMYRITLRNNDFFECNSSHILSLVCNANHSKRFYKDSIHNISVEEYIQLPKSVKHVLKSYKVGIEMPEKEVPIDPYLLGLWLGDGTSRVFQITNMDKEVEEYLGQYAKEHDMVFIKRPTLSKAFTYSITQKKKQWYTGLNGFLTKNNLLNNKHIPQVFLLNSRENRLLLLAGLLDTDGYLHNNYFEIFVGHKTLIDDVVFLARSLGFHVYIGNKKGIEGARISISGEGLEQIPTRVARRKAHKRMQTKNALRYGFTIKKLEVDAYYGFTIDGDRRFLLGDFTVTHNTVVFCEMVRLAVEKGTKVLVLTDRTELFKQTIKQLGRVGIPVEEISPTRKTVYERAPVYLAMIETLKRRMGKLEFLQPDLIIADECHKSSFNKLFEVFPNARVIGATATPVGKHFYEYYTSIVQNIDVPDLVQSGFLVPCKAYQMQDDFSDLKVQRGEFSPQSLGMHYNKPTLYEGVIENWKRYAQNKKTVVFNVSIEHTMNVHNAFLEAGISSGYITSKSTKEERERTLEAFKNGHFSVLNNCGILTTGWDEPSVECVVLNRATKSLPLFLQCMGRGSRLYPNKKEFIVLDFGGNHTRLGMWNENRIWEIKKKRETSGEAPVKACPECNAVVHTSTPSCPECKFIFPVKEKEIKKGVMVEVKPHIPKEFLGKRIGDLTISELCKLQKAKKYKATMIWRVIRSKGEQALYEYAQKMGYSDGWVYKQIHKLSDSTFTNYLLTA